ncbi:hypothetical protein FHW84_001856 [Dyella sp. SG562]|jgi:hypothetical protein|uniref:hypothetical protein n=1 Tax=unclassified Dyella TaxID=2634549 RepID=UPI0014246929|nr:MULTISPECIES: hypothetical protein [unclassified Dyella]MBT2119576.1 hypothetical protein [Dyella sp. LX-1]MBT2141926.1 hypothetical protein [Dyella sp. LX-66]NII73287.1 hypothetical protein [Dyella sp. SG562]NKJ19898.1 hypothetical protein [Dyella sp. SG609]
MQTIVYRIQEDQNGRWTLWTGDLPVSGGLRLGPAIKLARMLARERSDDDARIELVSCGHTIAIDRC